MNLFFYVEKVSWLHRVDPRSKVFALLTVFFLALGLQGVWPLLLLTVTILAAGVSAGFGPGVRRIRGLLGMMMLMTTVLWGLSTGEIPLWGPFQQDGLLRGLIMGAKLSIMVIAGLIWLSTTKIEEISIGMEKMGFHIRWRSHFPRRSGWCPGWSEVASLWRKRSNRAGWIS